MQTMDLSRDGETLGATATTTTNPVVVATEVSNDPNPISMTSSSTTTTTNQQQTSSTTTTAPNLASSTTNPRNSKNMSIKEFFTTRLMKNKSMDAAGSGAHSPKDETTNWFDEFKARMIKKSQKSNSNLTSSSNNTNNQDENQSEESNDSGDNSTKRKKVKSKLRSKLKVKSTTKDASKVEPPESSNLTVLNESFEDLTDFSSKDYIPISPSRDSITSFKSPSTFFSQLRSRRLQKISCVDRPDFDTSSINTIINRRDSRYGSIGTITTRMIFNRITMSFYDVLRWIISSLLPFNYTLPWKLISAVMFSLVIIVIGFASSANPNNGVFSFVNGFFCGISIATLSFIIIFLSLIVKILPDSRDKSVVQRLHNNNQNNSFKSKLNTNQRCKTGSFSTDTILEDQSSTQTQQKQDEHPTIELSDTLNAPDAETTSRTSDPTGLDDESYKGWMIEFVGDYESRNRGEVKLKLLYVKFENRVLYLYKVKSNQDIESSSFPSNVQSRIYDLKTMRNFSANLLFPKNVRNLKKWLWSKKYPIKIEFTQKVNTSEAMATISESPSKKSTQFKNIQLTLFTKTCREKEEWFRRFKRIVEEIRLAQMTENSYKHPFNLITSTSSESDSTSLPPYLSRSNRSSKREFGDFKPGVQASRSSTILDTELKVPIDCDSHSMSSRDSPVILNKPNLTRTKSCELIHDDTSSEKEYVGQELHEDWNPLDETSAGARNDNTLTQANVDIYSQAVGDLNFIETRPNLDYREYIEKVIESSGDASKTSNWFNSFTGRIFFDVFSQNYWSFWFKRKIQRKLHRIRLPYFMDTLTLTNIDLGSNALQFLNVVSHQFDSFGLSIDFDVSYAGGLTMTFETKLNLLKMKPSEQQGSNTDGSNNPAATNQATNTEACQPKNSTSSQQPSTSTSSLDGESNITSDATTQDLSSGPNEPSDIANSNNLNTKQPKSTPSTSSAKGSEQESLGTTSDSSDSDSDSSSDSSSDEADIDEISDWEDYGAEKTRQNLVRLVDKIASSRYFQQATENRYIKKKLLDISNCPLILVVKIESLTGVLTFNIPPPQTDRIWYGFRPNPELVLKAMPRMGDREVSLSHVTDWIERKLEEEFRKILVIPNMEDIVLPVLKSDHLLYVTPTK